MGYSIALLIRSDHILQIKVIVIIFPMLRIGLACPLRMDERLLEGQDFLE